MPITAAWRLTLASVPRRSLPRVLLTRPPARLCASAAAASLSSTTTSTTTPARPPPAPHTASSPAVPATLRAIATSATQPPMPSSITPPPFPVRGLLPKEATQALSFIRKHPSYDGRNVRVAVIDTGVDVAAAGLRTPGKMVDAIDCSGAFPPPLSLSPPSALS